MLRDQRSPLATSSLVPLPAFDPLQFTDTVALLHHIPQTNMVSGTANGVVNGATNGTAKDQVSRQDDRSSLVCEPAIF